jgi:hypothetical protein
MSTTWIYGGSERLRQQVRFPQNERWAMILSHLIVSLMMMCLTYALAAFFVQYDHSINPLLPVWGGILTWEAFLAFRVSRSKPVFSSDWLLARGVEWVVVLVAIKVVLALGHGFGALYNNLSQWEQDFGPGFFSNEYLKTLCCLVPVWVLGTFYTHDLVELKGNEFRKLPDDNASSHASLEQASNLHYARIEDHVTLPSDRRAIHQQILYRTLAVGVVMIFLVGFLRTDRSAVLHGPYMLHAGILSVILYFILALWLFSQTNFFALRAAWRYEHTSIHSRLTSRWAIYSILFLVCAGGVAAILPAGYSLGLVSTANTLVGVFMIVVEFLIGVIVLPFVLIFQLFGVLFGGGGGSQQPVENQVASATQTPAPVVADAKNAIPWWMFLKSFVFWGVFLIILGYALYQYIRQNKAVMTAWQGLPIRRWTQEAWLWLRRQFRAARKGINAGIKTGWNRLRTLRSAAPHRLKSRFINPSRLAPRQRVIFFYLALLRRGEEAGYPRQPSQTPYAYARILDPDFKEQANEVSDMTETFIEARYSRHEVTSDQAGRVKQAWEQLRGTLKSRLTRVNLQKPETAGDKQ